MANPAIAGLTVSRCTTQNSAAKNKTMLPTVSILELMNILPMMNCFRFLPNSQPALRNHIWVDGFVVIVGATVILHIQSIDIFNHRTLTMSRKSC